MSDCTKIGCESCKVYMWIGQNDSIYTGESECMAKLKEFFRDHKNYGERKHVLIFGSEYYDDYWSGWTEIRWD